MKTCRYKYIISTQLNRPHSTAGAFDAPLLAHFSAPSGNHSSHACNTTRSGNHKASAWTFYGPPAHLEAAPVPSQARAGDEVRPRQSPNALSARAPWIAPPLERVIWPEMRERHTFAFGPEARSGGESRGKRLSVVVALAWKWEQDSSYSTGLTPAALFTCFCFWHNKTSHNGRTQAR